MFWPQLKGGFLVVFRIWHCTVSDGLLYIKYLYVSRLSGFPCNCMTGWRILIKPFVVEEIPGIFLVHYYFIEN